LASMLEREDPVEGEVCDVRARGIDAEDTAGFLHQPTKSRGVTVRGARTRRVATSAFISPQGSHTEGTDASARYRGWQ
jgi:hypothetical protein